jgi:hypothetical protein
MASDPTRRPDGDDLQFDRAVHPQAPNASPGAGLACAMCGTPLRTEYFNVADQPTCASCKGAVERANQAAAVEGRRAGRFARAFAFGLAAAIAGAILYYGVIALTGWEIGLVAIVIGFMVGFAVRKGSGGVGGRRYQLLAVILTYFAVGLAYAPLAFEGVAEGRIATTLLFIFALPVMYIANSMPSGLISAIIILVGMQQAWKMTAKTDVPITGPYRVGSQPSASPA